MPRRSRTACHEPRAMNNRIVASVLVIVGVMTNDWLVSRMMLHMFLQLPLFVAAGVLAGHSTRNEPPNASRPPVLAMFVCVTGILTAWMIPRALDAAVDIPIVNAAKLLSLVAAGWLAVRAWRVATTLARTFVAGNTIWMTATVGMLYLDAPIRLCTSYRRGEQQHVGIALITITVLAAAAASWQVLRTQRTMAVSPAPPVPGA
jgi:hypothetical protein